MPSLSFVQLQCQEEGLFLYICIVSVKNREFIFSLFFHIFDIFFIFSTCMCYVKLELANCISRSVAIKAHE